MLLEAGCFYFFICTLYSPKTYKYIFSINKKKIEICFKQIYANYTFAIMSFSIILKFD